MKSLQLGSYLLSFFIFLATTLPANAGVVVVAYMGESQVVLVESGTYKTLATLETGSFGVQALACALIISGKLKLELQTELHLPTRRSSIK